jgi:hypothetical protein
MISRRKLFAWLTGAVAAPMLPMPVKAKGFVPGPYWFLAHVDGRHVTYARFTRDWSVVRVRIAHRKRITRAYMEELCLLPFRLQLSQASPSRGVAWRQSCSEAIRLQRIAGP